MELEFDDIKHAVSALHPAQAMEVAKIAQIAVAEAVRSKGNWDNSPALGNASLIAAVSSICESYARSKDLNPRTQSILSRELVSGTVYANTGALEAAFAAAANNNKAGKVGTAGSYVIQTSDGASWTTPATPVVGYLRTGVSTAGYATPQEFLPDGVVNAAPDNGGTRRTAPSALFGGFAFSNNGVQGQAFWNKAGQRASSPTARIRVATDEPAPVIRCTGFSAPGVVSINLNDGKGWRAIYDPAITPTGGIFNPGYAGSTSGGMQDIQLDLSQLGGRKARSLEFVLYGDMTYQRMWIGPVSSWYAVEPSPKMLFATDSLGSTVPQGNMKDAYPAVLQDFLGVPDICLLSEGSTGFLADAGGLGRTHLDKFRNGVSIRQYSDPSVVVIHSSGNDNSQQGIANAAETCIRYVLEQYARSLVLVIGPPAGIAANDQTNSTNTEIQVKVGFDRVVSDRLLWIPMMTDPIPYIRGNGTIDSPNGTGNADLLFRNGDTIHWSAPGHLIMGRDFFAPKIVAALRNWLNSRV